MRVTPVPTRADTILFVCWPGHQFPCLNALRAARMRGGRDGEHARAGVVNVVREINGPLLERTPSPRASTPARKTCASHSHFSPLHRAQCSEAWDVVNTSDPLASCGLAPSATGFVWDQLTRTLRLLLPQTTQHGPGTKSEPTALLGPKKQSRLLCRCTRGSGQRTWMFCRRTIPGACSTGKRFVDRPPPHPTGLNLSEARRPRLSRQDEPS